MKTPILLGVALGLTVLSCAGPSQPSSALPSPNAQGEYTPPWPETGRGEERFVTLHLGPDTFSYCRGVTPQFPFDKSVTYVQNADELQALASCLNHEEMRSRRVLLIGRTDASGEEAYNLGLGQRRAQAIKDVLIRHGLDADRIDIRTEGERGANAQPAGYSIEYGRRVDVVVTGGAHAP